MTRELEQQQGVDQFGQRNRVVSQACGHSRMPRAGRRICRAFDSPPAIRNREPLTLISKLTSMEEAQPISSRSSRAGSATGASADQCE